MIGAFRDALARDKTRTQVFDISELGLVEMTRKRIGEGLLDRVLRDLPQLRRPRRRIGSTADSLLETRSSKACCAGPDRRSGSVARAMYAVIASGGKQEKVTEGQQRRLELLDGEEGSEVSLTPVLVVDGDTVLATPDALSGASVTGKVVGLAKGPKINGFTYKRSSNQRRRYGHRQQYTLVEITWITKG